MNHEHTIDAVVPDAAGDVRVDKFIADELGLFSRSQMSQRNVSILVNGKPAKPSHHVHPGDTVTVFYDSPRELTVEPEPMPLEVLYEDDRVIVINKPEGVVVHPAAGNWSGTVVQGLLHHVRGLMSQFAGEPVRPGIVHRLDKDTSGVLIAAKDPDALRMLADQFAEHSVQKTYLAVVKGRFGVRRMVVKGRIERDTKNRKRFRHSETHGKEAETEVRLLRQYRDFAFLAASPRTGRTHQLRVQLQHLGCPILGDPLYSRRDKRFPAATLMLHAYRLSLDLPNGREKACFTAPLPERFKTILQDLSDFP